MSGVFPSCKSGDCENTTECLYYICVTILVNVSNIQLKACTDFKFFPKYKQVMVDSTRLQNDGRIKDAALQQVAKPIKLCQWAWSYTFLPRRAHKGR